MLIDNKMATALGTALATILAFASAACAHGFVGDRFFPPTIATDDPFAVDELDLPSVTAFGDPASDGTPGMRETDWGFEFDKEIFPHFALGISDDYVSQSGRGQSSNYGWDNIEISAKYQLWQNDPHEAIVSVGLVSDIGGTGSQDVADSVSTLTPTFYFGKGFGDLPESVNFLRPLAFTGTLGQSFPISGDDSNQFQWGFAVEYSLPYLQQNVKDIGLPAPFKDMIPLVEFAMATNENRDGGGLTTGTINPGVLWETPYFELGAEAVIPVNGHGGSNVGFILQTWIFIDDLFPKVFGNPIFGKD
ncbi:MAG TPA: hypothetical protein VHX86_12835 [Tepidisphaeraceae bacterium]|nr:hypothetical protein [Tepidisphaeraceae bacterium]